MREGQPLLLAAGQAHAPIFLRVQGNVIQGPQPRGAQGIAHGVGGVHLRVLGIGHGSMERTRRHEGALGHEEHVELVFVASQADRPARGPCHAQGPEKDALAATVAAQQHHALARLCGQSRVIPQLPARWQLDADVPRAERRSVVGRRRLPLDCATLHFLGACVHRLPEAPQTICCRARRGDFGVGVDEAVQCPLNPPQGIQDLHQLAKRDLALEVVRGQDAEGDNIICEEVEVAEKT
mmetsp:Transcript_121649/g.351141  ORF Transcript_121649/g.351141 Transcript_121649/m.351141 type:complete len:238 (-) Transcript_121649:1569-2282(-)